MAANSSEVSADPQVPLRLISASRASATGGKLLLTMYRVAPAGAGATLSMRHPCVSVLLVPGLVPLSHLVERVLGLFTRLVRSQQVLARARGVGRLDRHVPRAEPP